MKNLLLFCTFVFVLGSCKRAVEAAQEDLVIKAMTDGEWRVTRYVNNGTDITADFADYRFKFQKNNTVDAVKNGTVEKSGTWAANAEARTIASNFVAANPTVTLLNGTWTITKNSWTYVEANQTSGSEVRTLRLDK